MILVVGLAAMKRWSMRLITSLIGVMVLNQSGIPAGGLEQEPTPFLALANTPAHMM